MANPILLMSAICMGCIHLGVLFYAPPSVDLIIVLVAVILSSILNHALTSTATVWLDRVIVTVAALLIGYYLVAQENIEGGIWMIASLLFYAVAKLVGQTWSHLLAHGAQTISNIYLLRT